MHNNLHLEIRRSQSGNYQNPDENHIMHDLRCNNTEISGFYLRCYSQIFPSGIRPSLSSFWELRRFSSVQSKKQRKISSFCNFSSETVNSRLDSLYLMLLDVVHEYECR